MRYQGQNVGYGSVKGKKNLSDRDAVFEFHVLPMLRNKASAAFSDLVQSSCARFIECQNNDRLLTSLLYEHGQHIQAEAILFRDSTPTSLLPPAVVFRKRRDDDRVFEHKTEPVEDYVLALNHEVVANGGFALHYNLPFADLYMEVIEEHRRKGL